MRSSIIAVMLALAKCQQVCKIDRIVSYWDPECKRFKEDSDSGQDWADGLRKWNQMIQNGTQCQSWPSDDGFQGKAKHTCLNSETFKGEEFNYKGEDPDCTYPYPSYSDDPSYVAKSGECVRVSRDTFMIFYISSTTGK